jgi:polysaccharide biosynthesis/export protein
LAILNESDNDAGDDMLHVDRHTSWLACAVMLTSLTLAGCHTGPFVWVQRIPVEAAGDGGGGPLTISPGDVVQVSVFGQEAMSTKGEVRADGTLAVPLLGQVLVAGSRPEDVANSLKQRLKPYVNSPEVTVVILESHVIVSLVGEIKNVGVIEVRRPATVLQAIATAGGLTEFADRSGIYVLRTHKGVTTRVRFTWDMLIDADPAALSFRLRTGDVIVLE